MHVKPREERALTQAIRSVLGGEKAKLCFTVGHGELSLDAQKDERDWLGGVARPAGEGQLRARERRHDRPRARTTRSRAAPSPSSPVRASRSRRDEANRLRTWLLEGGSLLAAVGPPDATDGRRLRRPGSTRRSRRSGSRSTTTCVHDVGASVAIPDTHGEGFFVSAQPHPVTASLVSGGADAHPPRVATFFSRSLRHVSSPGAAGAADLLVTTADAYAKASLAGAAAWTGAPPRDPGDRGGPFVVAMAAERPRIGTATAAHGPRVVVVGSRFALAEDNWRQPRTLHGAAFFVDSALSWLASRPEVVDVPDRPAVAVAMRVSEEGRDEVRRYVLVLMPLAALLLGVAVWAWRRSSEDTPYVPLALRLRRAGRKQPKGPPA